MTSAADGRSWALHLAMSSRRALSLRGRASLRPRGMVNLAAIHRTAATQYTEAWVEEEMLAYSELPPLQAPPRAPGAHAHRTTAVGTPPGTSSEPGGPTADPTCRVPRGMARGSACLQVSAGLEHSRGSSWTVPPCKLLRNVAAAAQGGGRSEAKCAVLLSGNDRLSAQESVPVHTRFAESLTEVKDAQHSLGGRTGWCSLLKFHTVN